MFEETEPGAKTMRYYYDPLGQRTAKHSAPLATAQPKRQRACGAPPCSAEMATRCCEKNLLIIPNITHAEIALIVLRMEESFMFKVCLSVNIK